MSRSPRRRRAYSSRRSSSNGSSALILLAALLVVGGMGVAIQSKKRADATPMPEASPAPAAAPAVARHVPAPAPKVKAPASLVAKVTETVREAEKQTKAMRSMKRDARFTRIQTDTMAALSTAREELGAWLDEHPSDQRANKLWDRLQRVYITMKKS